MLSGAREEKGIQMSVTKAAHPTITYKPAELSWEFNDSVKAARASADRCINCLGRFWVDKNRAALGKLNRSRAAPYHPRNRKHFAIFDHEHEASCWA